MNRAGRAWVAPTVNDLQNAALDSSIVSAAPLSIGGLHDLYRVWLRRRREPLILKVGAPHTWEALGYEAAMLDYVSDSGVDCPRVVQALHGSALSSIKNTATGMNHPAILMTEIDGRHPTNVVEYEDVGKALGCLHQVPPRLIAPRYYGFGLAPDVAAALPEPIEQRLGPIARSMRDDLATQSDHLARVLCHGDLFPTNVMTTGFGAAFLDFGNMGEDNSCVDLGRMVFALSLEYGWPGSRDRMSGFLRGYSRAAPTDACLLATIPSVAFLAGVRISAWRYRAMAERWVDGARLTDWRLSLDVALAWLDPMVASWMGCS